MTTLERERVITLEPAEMLQAAQAGAMRQVENIRRGNKPGHGLEDRTPWQLHIEGALAECAVAKALGIYWPGKGKLRAGDVGALQVRSTTHESGHLTLYPNDEDGAAFVLVTGANGVYTVRGWLYGSEAKRDEYWSELRAGSGRPAFNVPQSALRSIDTLRAQ